MNTTLKIVLTAVVLCAAACGRVETGDSEKAVDTVASVQTEFVVDAGGAAGFRLGEEIPKSISDEGCTLTKVMVLTEGEGEQYEEPWYVLKRNGQEVLRVLPGYDPDTDDFSNLVSEIRIDSDACATKEGARVGQSLDRLAGTYTKLTFWYSYVSDMFVAETPVLPGVQFLLDGKGFVGSRDDLADSDLVFLSRSDFRPDTRIRTIRVLGEM